MEPVNFSKGVLYVNGYEVIVLNGVLRERYSQSKLESLNSNTIPGTASVPYHQQTLLVGEFSPNPDSLGSVLSGKAKFVCLRNDGVSVTYELELFGPFNGNVLASELETA